ncbi:hypothetical protein BT67DRAFT_212056 [Trichocladium antarcticum]|uniref:Uncharacterized protein n=1 Tax=Trichocladium antarcticum TaxID=1450529 RepID=A0AAN6UDF0_9PEZI|nr:hypothetical protein BT67DRAFT_212056 [Trichocladium antarcticum]
MRASLFLASATLASASRLECVQTRSWELANAATCGGESSLHWCFSQLPLSVVAEALPQELERCLQSAGCTAVESQAEVFWLLQQCDDTPSNDLRLSRRRSPELDDPSLVAAAKEPLVGARAAVPAAAHTAVNARRQDDTDAAATTTTNGDTKASPSPCFTDSTSAYTTCPIVSGKKQSCVPTQNITPVCRDGLICRSNRSGDPSCMYKQSSLGIAGIIIAVIFATAIAVSIGAICFMCCRERREHGRIERAAEAARIAKEAKTGATVAAKRPGHNVTAAAAPPSVEGQPLMYQTGPSSPGAHQQAFPQQYPSQFPQQGQPQGYGGAPNPFVDNDAQDAHPLR